MAEILLEESKQGHLQDAITNIQELDIAIKGLVKLGALSVDDAFEVKSLLAVAEFQLRKAVRIK